MKSMAGKVMIPMAEFDELVEPDELRYELDEGELIIMTRPRTFHNHIAGNFFLSLKLYLRKHPIGRVFNSAGAILRRRMPDGLGRLSGN